MECKNFLKELCGFDYAKERIMIRMMNRERERKIIDVSVHRVFLDLAAVYHVAVDLDDLCGGVILVTEEMMERWGVTEEILYETAMKNMDRDMDFSMKNILQAMMELASEIEGLEDFTEDMRDVQEKEDRRKQMFTIGDKSRLNGAVAIMRSDLLEEFASKLNSDLIILPSSIHELICLRDHKGFDYDGIRSVVREVNKDVVRPGEVLSDNIYRYTRETGIVEII